MDAQTPYIETEVLLAAINEDEDRAFTLLREMTPRELGELKQAAQMTLAFIRWVENHPDVKLAPS